MQAIGEEREDAKNHDDPPDGIDVSSQTTLHRLASPDTMPE